MRKLSLHRASLAVFVVLVSVLLVIGFQILPAQAQFVGCGTESWHTTGVLNEKLLHRQTQAVTTDYRFRWRPAVIRNDRKEPVLFEFKAASNVTFTSLVLAMSSGETFLLKDDGSGGDRVSGDLIYSAQMPALLLTSKVSPARPYRPFVGYLRIMNGSTMLIQYNLIAEIWNPSIPTVTIKSYSPSAQVSRHLVNLVVPVQALNTISDNDFRSITQTFYRYYSDAFDFINIIHLPSYLSNRYHVNIANRVVGIGLSQSLNISSQYGSAGKLVGANAYPISSNFDGASIAYVHELGHQWINYLAKSAFESGIPHWPLSSIGSGIMGISIGGAGGMGGEFSFSIVPEGSVYKFQALISPYKLFNNWELYLMGLLAPDSVSAALVLANQTQTPVNNATVVGAVTSVNLSSVIQQFGARSPNAATSQKSYSIATIIVSDTLFTREEMAFYDFFSSRAGLKRTAYVEDGLIAYTGAPFSLSTGGRAELNPVVEPTLEVTMQTSVTDTPPSVFQARCFPQPSSSETVLEYSLQEASTVNVEVVNVRGEIVQSVQLGLQGIGMHRFTLSTSPYAAGSYFVRLAVGEKAAMVPMQVTK